MARVKRDGLGGSISSSSRASIATLNSIVSSTGNSVYEDALEYRTEDEEQDSDAEDAMVLINGARLRASS